MLSENPNPKINLPTNSTIKLAYMNIYGQTSLTETKQLQIENFLKAYRIDILNCQEIDISEEDFSQNHFISSSFEIISNNATNKYGTCCFISSNFRPENVKMGTEGRVIKFDILQTLHLVTSTSPLATVAMLGQAEKII